MRLCGEAYGAYLARWGYDVARLVAYAGEACNNLLAGARYHKVAVLVGYAARDKGRVGGLQQLYVGIGDGLSVGVDKPSYEFAPLLLYTLHRDEAVAHGHRDRKSTRLN